MRELMANDINIKDLTFFAQVEKFVNTCVVASHVCADVFRCLVLKFLNCRTGTSRSWSVWISVVARRKSFMSRCSRSLVSHPPPIPRRFSDSSRSLWSGPRKSSQSSTRPRRKKSSRYDTFQPPDLSFFLGSYFLRILPSSSAYSMRRRRLARSANKAYVQHHFRAFFFLD
jgi:hypothetical protein